MAELEQLIVARVIILELVLLAIGLSVYIILRGAMHYLMSRKPRGPRMRIR